MSELCFANAAGNSLLGANATLAPGLTVVAGADRAALATLVALAAGAAAPARGGVLLDGAPVAFTPAARRKIAALLAIEALPPGRDVRTAVARILAARGDAREAGMLLERFGLSRWAARRPIDLDPAELRALALALALEHERAAAYVLFEPLAANHGAESPAILAELSARARSGAVVLVATSSASEAAALGGAALRVEQGRLTAAATRLAAPGTPSALYVVTKEPERLLSALAGDEALAGTSFDAEYAPFVVTLYGTDLEALGRLLARTASAANVPVEGVSYRSGEPPRSAQAPDSAPASLPNDTGGARPADQSVSMPTEFADPSRARSTEETR